MLSDAWPLFDLIVEMEHLHLRLPREEELAVLADVAAHGVHGPGERPFLTPWAEGAPDDRRRHVLQTHWSRLGSWTHDDWALGLGVFTDDGPVGVITLSARDFPVVREVTTSTWLGLAYHGRGWGTAARTGALALAFDHLDAESALTEVFPDNLASQGVSRKLGYQPDGISRDARGDEVLVSDRLRLSRTGWRARVHGSVSVTGLGRCRSSFGL